MIVRKEEMEHEVRHEMRGGDGDILMTFALPVKYLEGKGRGFNLMRVNPGCSVGEHPHEGEMEIYYVISGELAGKDNGEDVVLRAGDVMLCQNGGSHGVKNLTDEPADVLAVILYV